MFKRLPRTKLRSLHCAKLLDDADLRRVTGGTSPSPSPHPTIPHETPPPDPDYIFVHDPQ